MSAQLDFVWDVIGPNEETAVFIHPYSKREFTSFCIIVDKRSNAPGGAYTQVAAQMTDDLTYDFFGAVARKIRVRNNTIGPQPYIHVQLVSHTEAF
jgi:hypothetical protein